MYTTATTTLTLASGVVNVAHLTRHQLNETSKVTCIGRATRMVARGRKTYLARQHAKAFRFHGRILHPQYVPQYVP